MNEVWYLYFQNKGESGINNEVNLKQAAKDETSVMAEVSINKLCGQQLRLNCFSQAEASAATFFSEDVGSWEDWGEEEFGCSAQAKVCI